MTGGSQIHSGMRAKRKGGSAISVVQQISNRLKNIPQRRVLERFRRAMGWGQGGGSWAQIDPSLG